MSLEPLQSFRKLHGHAETTAFERVLLADRTQRYLSVGSSGKLYIFRDSSASDTPVPKLTLLRSFEACLPYD